MPVRMAQDIRHNKNAQVTTSAGGDMREAWEDDMVLTGSKPPGDRSIAPAVRLPPDGGVCGMRPFRPPVRGKACSAMALTLSFLGLVMLNEVARTHWSEFFKLYMSPMRRSIRQAFILRQNNEDCDGKSSGVLPAPALFTVSGGVPSSIDLAEDGLSTCCSCFGQFRRGMLDSCAIAYRQPQENIDTAMAHSAGIPQHDDTQ